MENIWILPYARKSVNKKKTLFKEILLTLIITLISYVLSLKIKKSKEIKLLLNMEIIG
jgi:hypothetical protein